MTLIDTGDISMRNVVRMQLFLTFFCEDTLSFCFYLFIFMEIHLFLVGFTSFKTPPDSRGVFKVPRMSGLSFRDIPLFCLLYPII